MINKNSLAAVIAAYKQNFPTHWEDEKYKWEAVQHFQDHWDINASDFLEMFTKATDKTNNLLAPLNNYPRRMIQMFAEADEEATRAMFINLYDESKNFVERVEKFQSDAAAMRVKYDQGTWKQHFQTLNSISTYLWLRYPDKYYIYKYSECRDVAKVLDSAFIPKKGSSSSNLTGGFHLYNEICEQLKKDEELVQMLQSVLTDRCYPDKALKTLTMDMGFYISRFYTKKSTEDHGEWFPTDYNPNITTEEWLALLADGSVFKTNSLKIMKRIKDYGGMATCKQLSVKYGNSPNFYNTGSFTLAKRVAEMTGCPLMTSHNDNAKWWPILYVGKHADKDMAGNYIWKLRDELSKALDQFDLSEIPLYEEKAQTKISQGSDNQGYWWLNANPNIWSFSNIGIGETQRYTLYNENGNKRRIFQNLLDAKAGDLIIGYESYPVKKVVALAKVIEESDGENLYFEKTEGLATPIDYATLKNCPELEKMEYFQNPQGSLFKLTKEEYDFIEDMIREENPVARKEPIEAYSKDQFLEEVYMTEERYETLISLLKHKKNLILQGAPGVGKTFTAKRLAYAMMGLKDDSRIELIQFHQNYSYEDFMMGYKPKEEGFQLQYGIFYRFCQKAANIPDQPFFFIIDEINRGNMSKIFGELLMLIEKDYRGTKATLAYNGMPFTVPKNLYMIGMMNTADRSLAMIDYALRRRFSFFEIEPGFHSAGFQSYQSALDHDTFNILIERIKELNQEIAADSSLGPGFRIGHSYFCGQAECTDEWLKEVVEYDILPMLHEYWFDEPDKLQRWENILRGVFNDER
ncbi:AAA family ATPase [Heyndrickxia coagulans]|uniref:AAA family ATPase n=1 Tax=Heyndrickxia coagulans TaxID=1398 RepID=UPI002DFF7989|nr:AAA family ATPase [Heyndrickxia coagulans]MEC5270247.1 AAA family ATPase [Heyndrickxia coagulans]